MLPQRKELNSLIKIVLLPRLWPLRQSRQKVTNEFPSLCVNSLPADGPTARLLDDSPFRVKLCLKEGD